jgi:hypothetical protein
MRRLSADGVATSFEQAKGEYNRRIFSERLAFYLKTIGFAFVLYASMGEMRGDCFFGADA